MTARESFGPTLKQQRERQGLTLAVIADSTRISPHLLRSLERGDVSRWPGGIYRRAFVRAYATAVGLPPEPTVTEFVRLFPEPGQEPSVLADDDPDRLRLTLEPEPRWQAPALRATAALFDAAIVLLAAYAASTLAGIGFWMPAAVVGLTYYTTGAVLKGRSPGSQLVAPMVAARRSRTIRDEVARLRRGWLPGLVDVGDAEHETGFLKI
jgi:transcriptional regulator with XRE-family HTH domain